ncbi:MAG: molybdopterin converting factor subunit 1 [Crocinitomicaceae bacterium]|nr:molybdopterin converting factor subunit 1 [Crocinitomicaceae bacterium]
MKVLYFAQVAEKVGCSKEEIMMEGNTTEDLLNYLKNKYAVLNDMTFKLAVDQTLIHENISIKDGTEVALLPPFAGG